MPKSPFATLSLGPGSRSASLHSPGTRGIGRRAFLTLLGRASAAPLLSPLAARGQQHTMPVIGLLSGQSVELYAERLRTFREVTLPLLLPAIGAAALLIFIFSFASFGVVLILGGPRFATVEVEIYRQTAQLLHLDIGRR